MNNSTLLQSFGKGKSLRPISKTTVNAVIYTRVSSKEQADTNQSLETQKKYCLQYALKNNLDVLGFFGGTYESAKTDERKEFNRMIRFVKNQKEGVSFILVYSLDRFSRTGDNAIFISSELKKRGISIVSVTQPIDVSTHSGVLQQNIQFIFSKYDNDLRREKCIAGMREKLLRGEWTGMLPVGYSYDHAGVKQYRVRINERGKIIAKAFSLKVQGLTNSDIALRVSNAGYKVNRKRISEIITNPFYCGQIAHSLLEGQLIKGKHEPLISEELFLQANDVLKSKGYGYKPHNPQINNHVPLKNFIRCADCNTPLTGYIVKKKNLFYYKCNKIGCKCNKSAKSMHALYQDFLRSYQVDPALTGLLKEQLLYTYDYLTRADKEARVEVQRRVSELKNKLGALEERFAFGEVERDIFERIAEKLRDEIRDLNADLSKSQNEISNPALFIDRSLKICSNLSSLWVSAPYSQKVQLQELLFPEGIVYDKKLGNYRTTRVNAVLEVTSCISKNLGENKSGQTKKAFDLSAPVAPTGIEPVSKV